MAPPGGPVQQVDYVMDGRGRRVERRKGGSITQRWLYLDGLVPVAEVDGSNAVVSRFVFGSGNSLEYMIRGGATYRFVKDDLGSVRAVVNVTTGAIAQRWDYDPWGNATLMAGTADFQPFGFAGGLYDPDSKLVRFGARDYDPEIGRWTAKDPVSFAAGSTNLYESVLSNPVSLIDPTGLEPTYNWPKNPFNPNADFTRWHAYETQRIASDGRYGPPPEDDKPPDGPNGGGKKPEQVNPTHEWEGGADGGWVEKPCPPDADTQARIDKNLQRAQREGQELAREMKVYNDLQTSIIVSWGILGASAGGASAAYVGGASIGTATAGAGTGNVIDMAAWQAARRGGGQVLRRASGFQDAISRVHRPAYLPIVQSGRYPHPRAISGSADPADIAEPRGGDRWRTRQGRSRPIRPGRPAIPSSHCCTGESWLATPAWPRSGSTRPCWTAIAPRPASGCCARTAPAGSVHRAAGPWTSASQTTIG